MATSPLFTSQPNLVNPRGAGSYTAATSPQSAFTNFSAPASVTPAMNAAGVALNANGTKTGGYQVGMVQPAAARPASPSLPTSAAVTGAFTPPTPSPLQSPGNNLVNQGYGEQALLQTQNRLLNDPAAGQLQTQYNAANTPTQGQNYMNQNLGALDGPGQGDQYWNQVQGQFNDPFAGEQFARQATQQMGATGAAGAFNNQAQQQYGQFTGFQGAGNAQGQYQQNAASGPLQGQQFYNQVQGQLGTTGTYSDPNLSAGQYAQTQGAFGDLPIAEFDPFYDRARQLGVQSYNQNAAGRGVYGSSEALSGVGNVITDIEAQRANRSFDAEMQRAVEQRNRQALLGQQAQMGDQSSIAAFNAGLQGVQTFGNLANMAGNEALGQQTMLGNQANMADTQALGAQNSNISGLNALGNAAQAADMAETNRFQARTGAMNAADTTGLNRLNSGVNNALGVDANTRGDFQASQGAAQGAAQLDQSGTRLAADIANQASQNDLNRLNAFNETAQGAEQQRFQRQAQRMADQFKLSEQVQDSISGALESASKYGADGFDAWVKAEIAPALQDAGMSQREKTDLINGLKEGFDDAARLAKK
jgi:hypothetical protein